MEVRRRRWRRLGLLVAGGLTVALTMGCSPGVNSTPNGYQGQGYGANLPNGADNPPANGQEATLTATTTPTTGLVVVDDGSATLYRYDRDSGNPPRSNCVGQCAKQWLPAEPGDEAITTKGISRRLVAKIKRPDGKWQLTLGGWPLYKFSGDKQAGDANGQGYDGVWFAAGPDGQKAAPNNIQIGTTGFWQTKWGPLSPADRQLLVAVRLAGLWEQPSGQMAVERAASPRVKQIGAQIAKEHIRLDRNDRIVASKLGVPLPNQATPEQKKWMSEMAKAPNGAQFDQIFVNRLRLAHGKIFPVIGAVRGATQNTLIREFAQECDTTVNGHMNYLESTGLVSVDDLPPAPPLPPPPAPKGK